MASFAREALVLAALASLTVVRLDPCAGQPCTPEWSDRFYSVDLRGWVHALAEFDGGSGSTVYAAGSFDSDGLKPLGRIARWDGSEWRPLGDGLEGGKYGTRGEVLCMFDDGGGPALFVGGRFTTADGQPAGAIARWDGAQWTSPGGGMSAANDAAQVSSLAVFDDGSGPALYAGGEFDHAGGIEAAGIARWDGQSWTPVGGGIVGSGVESMTVFDLGDGPRLAVGGYFVEAGGVDANFIAVWDGAAWSALGDGMDLAVESLAVYDAGNGPRLYAGGPFKTAGGVAANGVAAWDGSAWHALGKGVEYYNNTASVDSMVVHDDGTGPALYMSGQFMTANGLKANNIARYSGLGWSVLGTGLSNGPEIPAQAYALLAINPPEGAALLAGGHFELAGDAAINNIAMWKAGQWSEWTTAEGQGFSRVVYALEPFDDGTGEALYAGGQFMKAGLATASKIARWDGHEWSAVGTGFVEQYVSSLAVFDEGDGPRLFAGGNFDHAGAVKTQHVARWDGAKWTAVGPGVQNGYPTAMAVFDDGNGADLYLGGGFNQAGQTSVQRIARWDGAKYSALGEGLNGWCFSLQGFDDGSGPSLYVGGDFNGAGGEASPNIARWDGSQWHAIGADYSVSALAVYDDGGGPALYAGGEFLTIGQTPARRLARWDGLLWTEVGGGVGGDVYDLRVFDDGSGPALFVGGNFTEAGGIAARGMARWDGASWASVGSDITAERVLTMAVYEDEEGPGLYAIGVFASEDGPAPAAISRWGCAGAPPCEADLDGSGSLDLFDFLLFVNLFNAGAPGADCDQGGSHDLFDFLCFVNAFNAGC